MKTNPTNKASRSGENIAFNDSAQYPKRYSIEITRKDAHTMTIARSVENLSPWELYGLLSMMTDEIREQMRLRYDKDTTAT